MLPSDNKARQSPDNNDRYDNVKLAKLVQIAASLKGAGTPENLEALSSLVKSHSSGIRPVGSGPLDATGSSKTAIVKLDPFGGVGEIDVKLNRPGWVLAVAFTTYRLSLQIRAMRLKSRRHRRTNLGRSHQHRHPRYGRNLQALAAEIQGLRLITGTGEHIEISADQNTDWLIGRVALGALGILTEIKMQLVERFKLHRQVWPESHKHTLENAGTGKKTETLSSFIYPSPIPIC